MGSIADEVENPWYMKNYKASFGAKAEARMLSKIETVIALESANKNATRDTKHNHPSELSKGDFCPRASVYKQTDETPSNPDSFSLRRLNIFAEGNSIHDKWQAWMWKTGCLVGNWRCNRCGNGWMGKSPLCCTACGSPDIKYMEVPIYDDEHRIIGHADGEWQDDEGRALVELKSVGLGTIRWDAPDLYEGYESGDLSLDDLWAKIKRPLLAHRKQINLYMHCRKLDNAIVIYEWKPTQEVKEFHLTIDPEIVNPMLANAKLVNSHIDAGTMPERPMEARKSGMCKYCPYKDKCWEKQ